MGGSLSKEIEKAKNKGVTELDLKDRGISELPTSIGGLETLTKLNLSNNKISQLPTSIGTLSKLTELKVSV